MDTRELRHHWSRAPRLIKAHSAKRLDYWGRRIISSIKTDSSLFTRDRGRLKNSLWTHRRRGELVQEMGWAVPYGYVLEWGPSTKRTWVIKPKGFRSDAPGRSGGGRALTALRWKAGGEWKYARQVTHRWTVGSLRPHFEPWIDHHKRHMLQDLGDVPHRVLEGELV